MCNVDNFRMAIQLVNQKDVTDKRIIDVGAYDVNGSLRAIFEKYNPEEYVGVDMQQGPGVDVVCNAEDIVKRFGENSFDYVVSANMLEHVMDWKTIISNMKKILRPGGCIFIATPSKPFPYHEYPYDFWRYETSDFEEIFSDFISVETRVGDDSSFLPHSLSYIVARKPENFQEKDLSDYQLYSIVTGKRHLEIDKEIMTRTKKLKRRKGFITFCKKCTPRFVKNFVHGI